MNEELNKNIEDSPKKTLQKSVSTPFFDKIFLIRIINALVISVSSLLILFWIFLLILSVNYLLIAVIILVGLFLYFFVKNKENKMSIIRNVFIIFFLAVFCFYLVVFLGMGNSPW